ncbi:nucleoid-associated protein [Alphaproteobacteria bacterium]|nr:nucleoid-associated protein [Alphaproteobacteria bacterium]
MSDSDKNVPIKHIVVHNLEKTAGGEATVRLRPSLLDVKKETQWLIDTINKKYKTTASKSFGQFDNDPRNYPIQKDILDYYRDRTIDFMELTKRMMETLKVESSQKPTSTGGHVFFAHILPDGQNHLVVVIVSDKFGVSLDRNDMDVKELEHLNADGFRFAGRIDMGKWEGGIDRCVSFLRGKDDAADYFQRVLGCNTTLKSLNETKKLVSALEGFALASRMGKDEIDRFLDKAKSLCERLIEQGLTLSVAPFANELLPDKAEDLATALATADVSDGFTPHKTGLNPLVRFEGKTKHWNVTFRRAALMSGDVEFDRKKQEIILKNLPDALVGHLESLSVSDSDNAGR